MSRETTKYVWLKLGIRITGALCIIATILLILLKGFLLEEITVEGLSYYTKEDFLNKIYRQTLLIIGSALSILHL